MADRYSPATSLKIGAACTAVLIAAGIVWMWFPDVVDDVPDPQPRPDEMPVVDTFEEAPEETERLETEPLEWFEQEFRDHYQDERRPMIHATLDRPMYRPGDQLRFKSWHVWPGSFDRRGAAERDIDIELENPRGDVVEETTIELDHGITTGSFQFDEDDPGGNWTLRIEDEDAEFERPVLVDDFEPPRFVKDADFDREAYRPGEQVRVDVEITRDTGEPAAGLALPGYAEIDGDHFADIDETLDANGEATVEFELPERIRTDDATLVLSVEDDDFVETDIRPIPLALDEIQVDVHPEGGELVAGLESRVYFEATDLSGEPVQVSGEIVDGDGQTVTELETTHRGRGQFEFEPRLYRSYYVELDEPDADVQFSMPSIADEGCVMRVYDDFEATEDAIRTGVWCTEEQAVGIVGAMGDELFDVARMDAGDEEPAVAYLQPDDDWPRPAGIARVTVLEDADQQINPLAERVVFRNARGQMQLDIQPDDEVYNPGEAVELQIETTAPDGEALEAELTKAVVEQRVHDRATDQAPSILGRLLLEADDLHFWGDIDDADAYFEDEDPYALAGLDLLMGARGWRDGDELDGYYVDGGETELDVRPPPLDLHAQPLDEFEAEPPTRREDTIELEALGAAPSDDRARGGGVAEDSVMAPAPEDDLDMELGGDDDIIGLMDGEADDAEPAPDQIDEPGVQPGAIAPELIREDDPLAFAAWDARLFTDDDGHASHEFELDEAIGTYRVTVEGISHDGYVGRAQVDIPVELPLSAELGLPETFSGGDVVDMPVRVRNRTGRDLTASVEVDAQGPVELQGDTVFELDVEPDSDATEYVPARVHDARGGGTLTVRVDGDGFVDAARRDYEVEPTGFQRTWHHADSLPGENTHEVPLDGMTDVGATGTLTAYANPVSEALEGVDSMTRRPTGCFEQTSSINHPNVLVWRYLERTDQLEDDIADRLSDHLESGYDRLVGYEVDGGGFDWFGNAPANAPLSAWGLVQFAEMAEIIDTDPEVVDRTAEWLRDLRDGDGGWKRSDAWSRRGTSEPSLLDELFVLYGLARADKLEGFDEQLDAARQVTEETEDPYELALATAVLAFADTDDEALQQAAERLEEMQSDQGHWPDADSGWARSFGRSLDVETTGLATIALVEADAAPAAVSAAGDWLGEQKTRTGWWGSTQATVMALEGRIAYEEDRLGDDEGTLMVAAGDETIGEATISTDDLEGVHIDGIGESLQQGDAELTVESDVPVDYDLEVDWRVESFDTDEDPPLRFEQTFGDGDAVDMGDQVSVEVELENREDERLGMSVARLTLPAGVDVLPRELDDLVERTAVDYWETTAREVVLYFEDFDAGERHELRFSATADTPGSYEVPAGVAYPYYRDESHWSWGERGQFDIDTP